MSVFDFKPFRFDLIRRRSKNSRYKKLNKAPKLKQPYKSPTLPIDSSENRGRFGDLSLSRTYPTTFALPFVYTPNLEKKIEKK